jgi:hypothetical protein
MAFAKWHTFMTLSLEFAPLSDDFGVTGFEASMRKTPHVQIASGSRRLWVINCRADHSSARQLRTRLASNELLLGPALPI